MKISQPTSKYLSGHSVGDNKYALGWAKKIILLNAKGGKCELCGDEAVCHLDFHHDGNKERSLNDLIWNSSLAEAKLEVEKCRVMCRNCHQELHTRIGSRGHKRKLNLLSKLGLNRCQRCGYRGKNLASLDFHHKDGSDKKFSLSSYFAKNHLYYKGVTLDALFAEIEKCEILCRNCHADGHWDLGRYERLLPYILHKIEHYKTKIKIDESVILQLNASGYSRGEMAKKMGRSKSAICRLFKRKGLVPNLIKPGRKSGSTILTSNDQVVLRRLNESGLCRAEIARRLGCCTQVVSSFMSRNGIEYNRGIPGPKKQPKFRS